MFKIAFVCEPGRKRLNPLVALRSEGARPQYSPALVLRLRQIGPSRRELDQSTFPEPDAARSVNRATGIVQPIERIEYPHYSEACLRSQAEGRNASPDEELSGASVLRVLRRWWRVLTQTNAPSDAHATQLRLTICGLAQRTFSTGRLLNLK